MAKTEEQDAKETIENMRLMISILDSMNKLQKDLEELDDCLSKTFPSEKNIQEETKIRRIL